MNPNRFWNWLTSAYFINDWAEWKEYHETEDIESEIIIDIFGVALLDIGYNHDEHWFHLVILGFGFII